MKLLLVSIILSGCGAAAPLPGDPCQKIGERRCEDGVALQCERPGKLDAGVLWRELGTCTISDGGAE